MKNQAIRFPRQMMFAFLMLFLAFAIAFQSCVKSLHDITIDVTPDNPYITIEGDSLKPGADLTLRGYTAGNWNSIVETYHMQVFPDGYVTRDYLIHEDWNYTIISDTLKIYDTITNFHISRSRDGLRILNIWFDLNGVRIDNRHVYLKPGQ